MGHENLFFLHDSSASVCARMILALAVHVHVSQRTEKKKKQKRGEFAVELVVRRL